MNKEKQALICIISLIFLIIVISVFTIKNVLIECYLRSADTKYAVRIAEKNKTTVFRLSKLITYSGAEAKDNSDKLQDFNISQYSDIALYIDNHYGSEELTKENTIKELYVDNFKIKLPARKEGETQNLYYKNPFNMGKFREYQYDKIPQEVLDLNVEVAGGIKLGSTLEDVEKVFGVTDNTYKADSLGYIVYTYKSSQTYRSYEITVDKDGKVSKIHWQNLVYND